MAPRDMAGVPRDKTAAWPDKTAARQERTVERRTLTEAQRMPTAGPTKVEPSFGSGEFSAAPSRGYPARMTKRPTTLLSVFLVTCAGLALSGALGCASGQATVTGPSAASPPPPAPLAPPAVPPAIAVPAGAVVTARFHAVGAQVYACGASPAGGATAYAWTLKRPDATLSGDDGHTVGSHSAGPTWSSIDGSSVVGKKLAQSDAPAATAIPWLLVGAVSTSGAGVFANVSYVQRVATSGGKAPSSGCAAENVDSETHVPYEADYYFYRGGKP